jgi:ABC-type multidrug transport system fused ATPase/permease subunit
MLATTRSSKLQKAHAYEFMESLPKGLDTEVGERELSRLEANANV